MRPKTRRSILWSPLVLVALAFAMRLPMVWFDFVNVDEAAHLVGARELLGSGKLYETFVDNKPPLIYLFYALGGGSMRWLRLLAILLLWIPLGWLAGRGAETGPERTRLSCLYLVTSAGFVAADTHAVNTEVLGLLPLAFAADLFLRSTKPGALFVVGVLVGVAGLCKQPFLAFVFAPALALLVPWRGPLRGIQGLLPLLLGWISPIALASLVFLMAGSHAAYLRWVWLINVQHVSAPVSPGEALLRFTTMGLPLVLASSPLWFLAFWPDRGRLAEPQLASPKPSARGLFLIAAFVVTLLPAFLGFRLFGHYFLPAHYFLVQLAGPRFLHAWARPGAPRWLAAVALAPGVVFSLLNPFLYAPRQGVAPVTRPLYRELGELLRKRPCPGPLFVWGYAPQIYAYSERRPASRYVLPIEPITGYVSGNERFERGALSPKFHVSAERRAELLADLRRTPPGYVVDFSSTEIDHWNRFPLSTFPELEQLIGSGFRNLGRFAGGATVYESRACAER